MDGLGYCCALVLAAVFLGASVAKLARPAEATAGFAALGVPAPAVVARTVPIAELVVAAVLLAAPRAGGVAALAMLAAFSGSIVHTLGRGLAVPCNCFGSVRAEPVSTIDLLRNLLLAGLAVASLLAREPVLPEPWDGVVALLAVGAGVAALRAARRWRSPGPP